MAQRTSINIPTYTETSEAQRTSVRPDLQPAIQNFLAAQQINNARRNTDLMARLEEARQRLQGLQNDREFTARLMEIENDQSKQAQLAEKAARADALEEIKTKAGLIPTSSIQDPTLRAGIEGGQGVRDIPVSTLGLLTKPDPADVYEQKELTKQRLKIEKERPKAKLAARDTIQSIQLMLKEAEEIKNDPGLGMATGLTAPFAKYALGTDMKRVAARVETLKAQTLLSVLSKLKQLSAVGASGFGQLSNIEGENIRNSISTLDRGLSKGDFKDSLARFQSELGQSLNNVIKAYEETYGDSLEDASGNSMEDASGDAGAATINADAVGAALGLKKRGQ